MKLIYLEPRRERTYGGWQRQVRADTPTSFRVLTCSVEVGKRVRIAFKPRGAGAYGHHWHGKVVDTVTGKELWAGRVDKSTGCRSMVATALEHEFFMDVFGCHLWEHEAWDRYALGTNQQRAQFDIARYGCVMPGTMARLQDEARRTRR